MRTSNRATALSSHGAIASGEETATAAARVTRVLIVEDQALIRAGLVKLIESREGFRVIAEVGLGVESPGPVTETPDVIVVDLDFTDPNLLETLVEQYRGARILVVTSMDDVRSARRAIQLGAIGVISKRASAETFVSAIEKVAAGEAWLGRAMTTQVLSDLVPSAQLPGASKLTALSKRERQIVDVACEGLTNEAIARRLFISTVTVRHHLTAIFAKLGVPNRHSLIAYSYRHRRRAEAF